jgi:flavin reductase (DIM6/NTAB) family NADH-FMN oxidoreductase RutF
MSENRVEIEPYEYSKEFNNISALLVSVDKNGKPNMMMLDWKMIGNIGYEPIIAVAVAGTRYTFECLTKGVKAFTVNIVSDKTSEFTNVAGSSSGRNVDKFKQTGAEPIPGIKGVPTIKDSLLSYECELVGHSQIPFKSSHYAFFGKVVKAYASKDLAK